MSERFFTDQDIERLRNDMAKNATGYRVDAERFAETKQYATAANFMARAEAYQLCCIDIGRMIGLNEKQSIRVINPAPVGNRSE